MKKKYKKIISANDFQKTGYRKKTNGTISKSTEESEQASLLKWLKIVYPDVLYTVDLGGVNLTASQRNVHKTRCRRGHPDMMFQEWFKDVFCGLAIEFKVTGTALSEKKFKGTSKESIHLQEQMNYIQALRSRGWIAGFVVGRLNAEKVIKHYLEAGNNSLSIINKLIYPKMNFKNGINTLEFKERMV